MLIFRNDIMLPLPGQVRDLSRIWESLLGSARRKVEYKKHAWFSCEENDANTFSYIRSGRTGTVQYLNDGTEFIKLFIDGGCLLHEAYVLAGFCTTFPVHSCFTEVELYHFNGDMLVDPEFTSRHPDHMLNMLRGMSIKTAAQDMVRDIVAQKTVPAKIAQWMLYSIQSTHRDTFRPNITQLELGSMLHAHKSSINRAILSMQENGIIGDFCKRTCVILDKKRLEAIVEGSLVI